MPLDPLAPLREAFIRLLDNARPLKDIDTELPLALRDSATVGLVAISMSDLPTIVESSQRIDELLTMHAAVANTEAGQLCHKDSALIRQLIATLPASSSQ